MQSPGRIKRMISEGESEKLDFKQTITDAHKIAKTIVAFANNEGGTLLIGVRDNKSISGVNTEDDQYMVDLAASFYAQPSLELQYFEHELDGKLVLEVQIPKGNNGPYYAKNKEGQWWVYHRVGDKSLQASLVMYQVIKKQTKSYSTHLSYSYLEQQILKLLNTQQQLLFQDFIQQLKCKKFRIANSLAKLIYFNIVKPIYTNNHEYYTLVNE